ncbi:MAG: glycoside hydrolase family 76 protein, partial [Muribaculaceae bacterium]|nr:glycoside hydrolase family 76 protein [Muribaculaceae bacterium]
WIRDMSDRFYDDNVWLGIDFAELYQASGRKKYLDEATEIWKFIESGTDSILGGGIYWCEQKKHSKNTCSNAPGSVYALRLYEATGDTTYLNAAKTLYDWTRKNLQDPEDCLYFDNINLEGNIGKAKFAYNSGQMLEAASLLFKATGDSTYLAQAQDIAKAAFPFFFNGGTATDENGEFPLINNGNIWFTAIMMRGFMELYLIDNNPQYMEAFQRNLDYAWNSMRDPESGLFSEDWSGEKQKKRKWLLTQGAMAEMYATIAGISK